MLRTTIAIVGLVWFVVVWFVCAIGFTQLYDRHTSQLVTPPTRPN